MMADGHFEVVDREGRLVGDMLHATEEQARTVMDGLLAAGVASVLAVAWVIERTTVTRDVLVLSIDEQKAAA